MSIQEAYNQLAQFIGQPVEVEDATALDQCMDWAFKWLQILGIDLAAIRHQYAYQVWKQPNDLTVQKFEFIPNTPNGVPQQGDIPIFDQNVPGVTGVAGHICVATGEGDSNSFKSLDQNWNGVQKVTQETHAYTGVLGWLRPKVSVPQNDLQPQLDQCRTERDHNWDLYQADGVKIKSMQQTIDNQNQTINDRNNDITQLNAAKATFQTQLDAANQQVIILQPIALQVPDLKAQLAQAENDRQLCLNAQGDQNKKIANLQAQISAGKPQGFWNKLLYAFSR